MKTFLSNLFKGWNILILIAIILVIWFLMFWLFKWNNSEDSTIKQINIEKCKSLVKKQLKSPHSAVFSDIKYSNWFGAIVGWRVDSQNSFWAMLRTEFICFWTDMMAVVNDWENDANYQFTKDMYGKYLK